MSLFPTPSSRPRSLRAARTALPYLGVSAGIAAAIFGGQGCGRNGGSTSTDVLGDVGSIVFAKRANYDSKGNPVVAGGTDQVIDYLRYVPGGGVYTLTPPRPDGKLENLTERFGDKADVNGLDLSFDGKQIVFSAKISESDHFHIWIGTVEKGADGKHDIHQLTFGERDDVMPIFVPGDRIAFVSNQPYTAMGTRADEYEHAAVVSQIATISTTGGDADRRECSQNLSHTVNVFLRSDGTIGFSRWEHLGDVNDVKLFKMNPDCTQMVAIAGQHDKPYNSITQVTEVAPELMIGIASPRNRTLQAGAIVQIDAHSKDGVTGDEENATYTVLTPGVPTGMGPSPIGRYKNPNILPDGRLLVSWATTEGGVTDLDELSATPPNFGLYVYDTSSHKNQLVYDDPRFSEVYAKPVRARTAPSIIYDVKRPDPAVGATIGSIDITQTSLDENVNGAQFANVKLASALKDAVAVRIIEGFSSEVGAAPMFGLTMHEGAAVLGEAAVYGDGSWEAKIPPYIPVHLQPIDKFGMSIRSQGLWMQGMPGEERRCGGCHESRTAIVVPRKGPGLTVAQQKGAENFMLPIASRKEYGWDKVLQPILDAKCVSCHGPDSELAKKTYTVIATSKDGMTETRYEIPWLDLSGGSMTVSYDMGVYTFSRSYVSLYYPAQLKGGMARGLKVVGELPPVWMQPASARASILIKTLNPKAADGTVAWPDLKQHGVEKGFTLTTEEMGAFIKSADLGGQFTSRQNVKSAACWMSSEADIGKCGNGAGGGGTVYP
jgi:hypothetical protein